MDIEKILQRVRDKFLKEEPKPESEDERLYYRLTTWEGPEDFDLFDEDGNPIKFEDI